MRYKWGQISDRTQKVKALIGEISSLALDEEFDVAQAIDLLGEISIDFPDGGGVFVEALRTLLEQAVDDGQIDNKERALISSLAHVMSNPISDDPVMQVEGKRFVLSGDFGIEGGKETVKKMIIVAGGRVTSSVSGKTDYVIVGSEGNEAWAFGNYGRKVKDALDLQLTGRSEVKVVTEKALLSFFEERSETAMSALKHQKDRFREQWESAQVVCNDFSGLTEGQQKAFDLVREGKNIYLTGLGGTGKSYVLDRIIEWAKSSGREVLVCAPTGIAALNIGGSTIHRTLGIRPERTLDMNPTPYIPKDSPLHECDLMIVDEISMCRLDLFDYLSLSLRKAAVLRKKEGKPCSQLVVVGDFCQLPPVTKPIDKPILREKYGFDIRNGYPFMGREWNNWKFIKVELTKAIRQRDADFVAALNACRIGDTKGVRWIEEHASKKPDKNAIVLCGTNSQANRENLKRLKALPSEEHTYQCMISGEVTEADMPTAQRLTLKPGARIMALVNDSETTYMNGSLGTVIICKRDSVIVDFDGLGIACVPRHTWEITKPKLIDGRTKYEVIGTFDQVPLKLAWAITIHKAQGQTFESAIVYPDCWDDGQLYTALSRLTRVEGLYLAHKCSDESLSTSPDVIDFLEGKYAPPQSQELPEVESSKESEAAASLIGQLTTHIKQQEGSDEAASTASNISLEKPKLISLMELRVPLNCGLHILERNGLTSINDLVGLDETRLLKLRGMGITKVNNLRSFLREKGVIPTGGDFPLTAEDFNTWVNSPH